MSRADSAYRLLLHALPADLRRDFGDDMVQLFRDHRAASAGPLARLQLWLAATVDVLHEAIAMRAASMRRQAPLTSDQGPNGRTTTRSARRLPLRSLLSDFAHGFRLVRRAPGASLLAILTLALGIGANTAIFSVVDAVMIRALPYDDPDRLVMVWEKRPAEGMLKNVVSPADFLDWRRRQTPFTQIAALIETAATVTGAGEPEQVGTASISAGFFEVLGIRPAHGRTFREDDETFGRHRLVMITHGFWRRKFGADPSAVGRMLTINGTSWEIVGVLPASFRFPSPALEIWVPMVMETPTEPAARASHQFLVYGRLKPGVTLAQSRDAMDRLARDIETEHPDLNRGHGAWVTPLRDEFVGPVSTGLVAIFAAVGLVLLIACVNVVNLQLTRAASRRREMAVRSALGAGRARLIAQSLAEHLALAVTGGAMALVLAWLLLGGLPFVLPEQLSVVGIRDVSIDVRVVLFAVGITLVAGALVGLLPAIAGSRPSVTELIKSAGRGAPGTKRRARTALVVAEVALASLTLVGAGLVVRSFTAIVSQPLGFETSSRLAFGISVPSSRYTSVEARRIALATIEQKLAALPGVMSVGAINLPPLAGGDSRTGVGIDGYERAEGEPPTRMHPRTVTPGYFATMSIPIVQGRGFTAQDGSTSEPVVIISEASVRRFFPDRSPLGVRMRFGGDETWRTIIGVAGDVRHWGLTQQTNPMVYLPQAQSQFSFTTFVLKTAGDPMALAAAARARVAEVDPLLPLARVRTYDDTLRASVRSERAQMVLMGGFGVLALLLAVVGIYGVTSQLVAARVLEIGVRMTLGARPRDVLRQILGEGLWQAVAGVAIGLIAGVLVMRLGQSLLFNVAPWDPVTLAAVAMLLVAAALLACLVPARRAMRIDPADALRG